MKVLTVANRTREIGLTWDFIITVSKLRWWDEIRREFVVMNPNAGQVADALGTEGVDLLQDLGDDAATFKEVATLSKRVWMVTTPERKGIRELTLWFPALVGKRPRGKVATKPPEAFEDPPELRRVWAMLTVLPMPKWAKPLPPEFTICLVCGMKLPDTCTGRPSIKIRCRKCEANATYIGRRENDPEGLRAVWRRNKANQRKAVPDAAPTPAESSPP